MWSDKVHSEEYENIIILDAARYDFTNEIATEYPNINSVSKSTINSSSTHECLYKNFSGEYNYTVFSANPFLNSYNKSIDSISKITSEYESESKLREIGSYIPNQHFYDIKDVWKVVNGTTLGVTPEQVSKFVLDNNTNRKKLIWFTQPHEPYIGKIKLQIHNNLQGSSMAKWLHSLSDDEWPGAIRLLRESYLENLSRVLFVTSALISELDGKTLITSDHGELLGEDKSIGHAPGRKHWALNEVPIIEPPEETISIDSISNLKWIKLAYENLLGRKPRSQEIQSYQSKLEDDMTKLGLLSNLRMSEEYDFSEDMLSAP